MCRSSPSVGHVGGRHTGVCLLLKETMVLLEFSISPLDKGQSVSAYVARSLEIIEQSGLDYRAFGLEFREAHRLGKKLVIDVDVGTHAAPLCIIERNHTHDIGR